jgi:YD repeat-containing protein
MEVSPTPEPMLGKRTGFCKESKQVPIFALQVMILLLCTWMIPAHAEVRLPNGEYRFSQIDLQVKSLSGYITIERTWQSVNLNRGEYRWHIKPAWADLDINGNENFIVSISRNGAVFRQEGDDVYILKESDRRYAMVTLRDDAGQRAGFRWSDGFGNLIYYDTQGRIKSYNDRTGQQVFFDRDAEGHLQAIRDDASPSKTLLTFTWENNQVTSVSDYSGRSVQYHYSGNHLVEVIDVLGNHLYLSGRPAQNPYRSRRPYHHTGLFG